MDDIRVTIEGLLPQSVRHPLPFRCLIFDVDGTLRRCTIPGQPCPNKAGEWALLPHVKDTLALYPWGKSCCWGLVTNQGGVGLGYLTAITCWDLLWHLVKACGLPTPDNDSQLPYGHIAACIHPPSWGCACRKPSPLHILQIAAMFDIPLLETLYIGDQETDREAAARANVNFLSARDFFGWAEESSPA